MQPTITEDALIAYYEIRARAEQRFEADHGQSNVGGDELRERIEGASQDLYRKRLGSLRDLTIGEIGIGSGDFVRYAFKERARAMFLIDISKDRLVGIEDELKALGSTTSATAIVANAQQMNGINDGELDLLVAKEVIEHLTEYPLFLRECRRVLRKGGRLYLTTPNRHCIDLWPRVALTLVLIAVLTWYGSRGEGSRHRGLLFGEPRHSRKVVWLSLLLACLGSFIIGAYFIYARAYLGGWEPATFYHYSFASTPFSVVAALLLKPMQSWPVLVNFGRLGYLLEALLCTVFLPLRSRWFIAAIPGLAIVLLANSIGVWRIGAQYALLWVPWLMLAFGDAAIRLAPEKRGRWFVGCAVVLVIISLVGSPLHLGTYLRPSYHDLADARLALAKVGNVALSTHDEWQTHISVSDPLANSVLFPTSQWLVYADDYPNQRFQTVIKPQLKRMVRQHIIRVYARYGQVIVYHRIARSNAL